MSKMIKRGAVLLALIALLFSISIAMLTPDKGQPSAVQHPNPEAARRDLERSQATAPLRFEPNMGQTAAQVRYLARTSGYTLFLTDKEAVVTLGGQPNKQGQPTKATALRFRLAGANPQPTLAAAETLPSKSNYFIGNDASKWHTDVANYARISYQNVYPGVDLAYYGNAGRMEYDFVAQPGADLSRIQMHIASADSISLAGNDLAIHTASGTLYQRQPVVYQNGANGRQIVAATYQMTADGNISFNLAAYDRSRAIVIDPVLDYSSYFGGLQSINADEFGEAIAVDAFNNAYITGKTYSSDFPTSAGALDTTFGGQFDAFVSKFNPNLNGSSSLIYSTYLGGGMPGDAGFTDEGKGIAVDTSGNAFVTGWTGSTDFPLMNPISNTLLGGNDAFVVKLAPTGSTLLYSTFLGGNVGEQANAIVLNGAGEPYITGWTTSGTGFPVTGPITPSLNGPQDAFVVKVNGAGTAWQYATFLGGNGIDEGNAIALVGGNAYVVGTTASSGGWPPATNTDDNSLNGGNDAFVARLNAGGNHLDYFTYFGGDFVENGYAIAADAAGNAYITGYTNSAANENFPILNAYQPDLGGGGDAFVAMLNTNVGSNSVLYSSYYGGDNDENGYAITLDGVMPGNVYIGGQTASAVNENFPLLNAFDSIFNGGTEGFIAHFNLAMPGAQSLIFSSYFGGDGTEQVNGLATDLGNKLYAVGSVFNDNFPTTLNAWDTDWNGGEDAFIAKIDPAVVTATPTASPSPSSTPSPTDTPIPSSTPTQPLTSPTLEASITPGGPNLTDTPAPSNTPTRTPTPAPTNTPGGPTNTPTATLPPSNTPTPTWTPGGPTATPTRTPTPTWTPGGPTVTPTATPATPFSDLDPSNMFYQAIYYFYSHGIVLGTDPNHFDPVGPATRAQFAKIVVSGFGIPLITPTQQHFTDVPTNYFAYGYIETGLDAGILSGYDANSCAQANAQFPCFIPNRPITRAQLTKLVVMAAHYALITPAQPHFGDVPANSPFYSYIETAFGKGIIHGFPDNTFRPDTNIRRDHMCQIVYAGIMTP